MPDRADTTADPDQATGVTHAATENDRWGERPALLVVDVSRKRADPSLDTSLSQVVDATDTIADLEGIARDCNVPVFYSRGGKSYYTSSGADVTEEERGGWVKQNPIREESATEAQYAFELAPQLSPNEDEIITKRTPSAFFESSLADRLDDLNVDTLIVTGIMTSCCIRATVTDAFANNYWVVMPEDCIADRRPAAHAFHTAEMNEKFADVVDFDAVVSYLRATA